MYKLTLYFVIGVLLFFSPLEAPALEGKLNINSATTKELEMLPFTGKGRANAIVKYRQKNGSFESLEELLQINDIGPSTFEAIKPYLVLRGTSTLRHQNGVSGTPNSQAKENTGANSSFRVLPRIITQPGEIMLLPDQLYYDTLVNFLHNADQRIDVAMFLFKTTKARKNRPSEIAEELAAARKRGLEVNVTLEESGYDESINRENGRTAKDLKDNGAQVHFDTRGTTSHMKIVIVDQRFCFVGSHNFTHAALALNHEFSVLIDSPALAAELLRYIKTLQAD